MGRAQSDAALGRVAPARLAAAIWMTALVVLGVSATAVAMGRMTHGFIAYYTASRVFISGELDARIYDDAWFMGAVQRVSGTEVKEIFGPNPPAMALLALPVVAFEPSAARAIWLTASLIAFAAATWFWLRRVPRHDLRGPVVIAIAMLHPAVLANLRQAQAYLFVFAALTWVARSSLIGRDTAGGSVAGLLVALKSSGLPWWALSAVERRWRFVAAAAASWLLLSGIVFAVTGLEPWLRYPRYVAEFVQRPGASATAYQTTWSLARRVVRRGSAVQSGPCRRLRAGRTRAAAAPGSVCMAVDGASRDAPSVSENDDRRGRVPVAARAAGRRRASLRPADDPPFSGARIARAARSGRDPWSRPSWRSPSPCSWFHSN